MKRHVTGVLRRSILLVAGALVASLVAIASAQAITNGQPDGNRHPNVGLMVVSFPGSVRCHGARAPSSPPPPS